MTLPPIRVEVHVAGGCLLAVETRRAFNAGIRAGEAFVRECARAEGHPYTGEAPVRRGDVYTRRWLGRDRILIVTVTKGNAP